MSEFYTPTTELEAVNTCLRGIGERSVSSLESDEIALDAAEAQSTIHEVSRSVQTRGWYWNKETRRLTPSTDNKIPLPLGTLELKPAGVSKGMKLTLRDGFLYNIAPFQNTFIFDGPIEVSLTLFLKFENLPETARRYISLRASRIFQARFLGDELMLKTESDDEQTALAILHAENLENEPLSLKDALSVSEILGEHLRVQI